AGVAFVDNGDGSGALSGIPELASEGIYTITLSASNLFGSSAPQTFTLKVQAAVPKAHGGSTRLAAPISISLGALPAGKRFTITFDVLIVNPLPIGVSQIVNQGMVSGSAVASVLTDDPRRPGAADPTITSVGPRRLFLPLLIQAAGPPLPDLVVESISSAGGKVSVTIRNDGSVPVVDAFWIDLYIAPTTVPTRANQLWSDVGSRGATWGVIDHALPIAPGARLTVSLGDSYYRPLLSNPGGPIAAGTPLYAQVDSFNANSANGAVLESHERDGGAYNNILGPVAARAP